MNVKPVASAHVLRRANANEAFSSFPRVYGARYLLLGRPPFFERLHLLAEDLWRVRISIGHAIFLSFEKSLKRVDNFSTYRRNNTGVMKRLRYGRFENLRYPSDKFQRFGIVFIKSDSRLSFGIRQANTLCNNCLPRVIDLA